MRSHSGRPTVRTRRRLAIVAALVTASYIVQAALSDSAASIGEAPTTERVPAVTAEPVAGEAMTPNIVLIVTDDQRWDTLRYMPIVRRRLGGNGVIFERAYVVNPVCCPSRATMATGQYSHGTGVYTNHPNQPYGGFPAFADDATIATWLDDAGYRTALVGKYLNGYASGYVPPGWDRWFSTYGGGAYYDYRATSDGREMAFGAEVGDYGTNVLADEAVGFIRDTAEDEALFLLFAPHAPHEPAVPAPGDDDAFGSIPRWRPGNYDEDQVADKPEWFVAGVASRRRSEAGSTSSGRTRSAPSSPSIERSDGSWTPCAMRGGSATRWWSSRRTTA